MLNTDIKTKKIKPKIIIGTMTLSYTFLLWIMKRSTLSNITKFIMTVIFYYLKPMYDNIVVAFHIPHVHQRGSGQTTIYNSKITKIPVDNRLLLSQLVKLTFIYIKTSFRLKCIRMYSVLRRKDVQIHIEYDKR